jgi:hypothetical protein
LGEELAKSPDEAERRFQILRCPTNEKPGDSDLAPGM